MNATPWEGTETKDKIGGRQLKAKTSEAERGLGVNILYGVNAGSAVKVVMWS